MWNCDLRANAHDRPSHPERQPRRNLHNRCVTITHTHTLGASSDRQRANISARMEAFTCDLQKGFGPRPSTARAPQASMHYRQNVGPPSPRRGDEASPRSHMAFSATRFLSSSFASKMLYRPSHITCNKVTALLFLFMRASAGMLEC